MSKKPFKVALIHDEFVRRGGAEVVFEEMLRIWPQARVYGLYASNRPALSVDGRRYEIQTSSLQRLPLWFRKHPGRLLPLLPHAAEQFDLSDFDLVLSSSSGFAKGVITRSSIPHICYCHTPTRYLWDSTHAGQRKAWFGGRFLTRSLFHYLRMADFAAAQRPDVFIANSRYTQQRIRQYYRRESEVVYPPIHTEFFTPLETTLSLTGHNPTERPFVLVGRLTPAKHFEQAIIVCAKLQLPLVVVGVGRDLARLKAIAGPKTLFIGKATPEELRQYLRGARALIQPAVEDFGMATVEALACGTPVIAYGEGGVKEIVVSGKHGVLYRTPQTEGLAEALRQFMMAENRFEPALLQAQAMRFSAYLFRQNLEKQVEMVLQGTSGKRYI
ncbi:MAG: glycosyltransferase [Candidatus Andersenbacteria bacterium]|nr:glycosyltransferase [Candidatus Andersenbacteria bacterium]